MRHRCRRAWGWVVLCQLGCLFGCGDRAAISATGERPSEPGVLYAECIDTVDCTPLQYCVHPPGEPGFCSMPCDPADDPESCDESPGGSATRTCADIGSPSTNLCALACGSGKSCPGGMHCQQVMSNDGARSLCF